MHDHDTPNDAEPNIGAVVIRPGDHVLLTVDRDYSADHAQIVVDKLRDWHPGVEFAIVAGIGSVLVQHAEDLEHHG